MLASNTDGLQALHLLLIKARALSFETPGNTELAEVLDTAEFLVTCILSEDQTTETFRNSLNDLGDRFPEFAGIAANFETLADDAQPGAANQKAV